MSRVLPSKQPGRRGFTLADLVITVLIIGILASVTAPKYADSVTRIRVEAAAKRVAADLRYARQHAKTASVSQDVVFDLSSNKYTLPGINDINHTSRPFEVHLDRTSYPASLVSASFGAGGSTVTFDMFGRPDNGGTAAVQVGDKQRTITVDSTTGSVSTQP